MEHKNVSGQITIDPKTIFNVFLFALLFVLIYILRNLVLILLTSIVITSFVESAVTHFERYRIHRTLAVVIVYLTSLFIIFGLFYIFAPILINQISSLFYILKDYIPDTSVLNNFTAAGLAPTKDLVQGISSNVPIPQLINQIQNVVSSTSGGFIKTTSLLFGGIFNLIALVVISFYLSMQEHGIENFLRIMTPSKNKDYVLDLWRRTEKKIGLWMQGQMLLGVLIGILVYLGLTLLGVQYALVLALLASILELIPLGLILAGIPVLGFAYAGGGLILMTKAFILFLIIQQFEAYLISPLIVKKIIGISPLVVILSILIGAELAGFWGIILAIPVSVFLLEYIKDLEKLKASV